MVLDVVLVGRASAAPAWVERPPPQITLTHADCYLDSPVWERWATVGGSCDMSGYVKFIPLLSFELRRGRVLGDMVNVVLLVQWFWYVCRCFNR